MTRRDILKAGLATLASFILPAPRRLIDLTQFCAKEKHHKFDMRLPYEVNDWTYATDRFTCVRVPPMMADRVQHEGEIPPFEGLSWNHERIRGWRELPRRPVLLASDSCCPVCEGYGHIGGAGVSQECETCDGAGHVWTESSHYHICYPKECRDCKGKGYLLPVGARVCPSCNGNADGVFPALVELDGRYFDVKQYERAQRLGADFVMDNWKANPSFPMMKFKFDGGCGLMMAIDPVVAEKRVADARRA